MRGAAGQDARPEPAGSWPWLERGTALGLLGLIVVLHVELILHAGALWRDEVSTVNIASMPLTELWASLQFDSFPLAWYALLRAWSAAGLGSSDLGLRLLGLMLGLGIPAVIWLLARWMGAAAPLFSLALLGVNSAVICYGDSIRAYGLGMLTGLLAFGLVWRVTEKPDLIRAIAAASAGLLSVHCVYYNPVLLLAACAGGAAVALRRSRWKTIPVLFGVGIPAALSMGLYWGTIRNQSDWVAIVRWPIDSAWIWRKFIEATQSTSALAPWLWVAFALIAVAAAAAVLVPRAEALSEEGRDGALSEKRRDAVLFCAVALVVGIGAYLVFLLKLSYLMQPWYFLSLMALVAACLDGVLLVPKASRAVRLVRAAAAVLIVALAVPRVWASVRERKTNMDLVATALSTAAVQGDVIIVMPWLYGITFDRYYRGRAEWTTIPPVSSHGLHRYDLLAQAMMNPDAMRPALERIEKALRDGRRVYWVGNLAVPPDGQGPPVLPPATRAPWGWQETPYYNGWSLQAGHLFREHALRGGQVAVSVPSGQSVSAFENLPVSWIEGWR